MKVVQPICDFEKVKKVMLLLKSRNERDYILFMTGLYTALRISDILRISVENVKKDYLEYSRIEGFEV